MTVQTILAITTEKYAKQHIVNVRNLVLMHSETRRLYEITSVNRRNQTVVGPELTEALPASEFEPTLLGRLPHK